MTRPVEHVGFRLPYSNCLQPVSYGHPRRRKTNRAKGRNLREVALGRRGSNDGGVKGRLGTLEIRDHTLRALNHAHPCFPKIDI